MQRQRDLAIFEPGRLERIDRRGTLEDCHLPARLECVQHVAPAVAGEPVREPECVEIALRQRGQRGFYARCIRLPGLRREARQPVAQGLRALKRCGFRAREVQRRHRPVVPSRLGQKPIQRQHLRAPVLRRRPGTVKENEKRRVAISRRLFVRIEDRPGQADDDRRHGKHPQQEKPPGRAVADLLVVFQAHQQHDAGEHPPHRGGRDSAQDHPEDGKGQKTQKQPRRREAEDPEQRHAAPPSIARQSHRSADCAVDEV